MEIDLGNWRRRFSSRCRLSTDVDSPVSVINPNVLHLVILALILVAMPNSIGAVRRQNYDELSSNSKLENLHYESHQASLVSHRSVKLAFKDHGEFVKTSGHQFTLGGKALYVNGANIYWLMSRATEESSRSAVTEVLQQAAGVGVTVVRTWAFADGNDYHPLQLTPGIFDESVFQGLDFVVSEATRNGIRLILSLVNNYGDYGGKPQYVAWANQNGGNLSSEDDFFSDATIRSWFKDYIKTVITRVNTITGVTYRDEPAIFAWELMNEPRCSSDTTGNTFQAWLGEMAAYVKSVDGNHLLTTGQEGFYSSAVFPESVEQESSNPGSFATQYGVDFIRNHQVSGIDFASVHSYPDNWMPSMTESEKQEFMRKWIQMHINDGTAATLKKPVLFAEFGKSRTVVGYTESVRVSATSVMFDAIYDSAVEGGAGAGAFVWQLITNTTTALADGFEIMLSSDSDIASLMQKQASRLSSLS